jgi:hypothetical protein
MSKTEDLLGPFGQLPTRNHMNKTLDSFIQISENFRNFIEEKALYAHDKFYNGLNAEQCKKDLYKKVVENLKNDYFCLIADMYDNSSANLFFGNKKTIEKEIEKRLITNNVIVYLYDFNQDKQVRFKSRVRVELDS